MLRQLIFLFYFKVYKMGKNTSINVRLLVIFHREKGKSLSEIGKILNLSKATVQSICNRYYEEGRIENLPSSRGPRKITPGDEKFVMRQIKRDPKLVATELTAQLTEFSGTVVHPITIRRMLKKNNHFCRVSRRKPLISEINRKKRLKFALEHKDKPLEFWRNVLFIDESKFSIFQSDKRQQKIWRKPNEAYKLKNLCSTVKHGGQSVMVWGSMGHKGVGNLEFIEGNMNKEMYLSILKTNLKESARKLGIESTFHFYQDNDPKHKSLLVRTWLLCNCPKVMETPPQSPDINPIEHLWEYLDRKIRSNNQARTKKQLQEVILEEWSKIPFEVTQKLVDSIPNRLKAIIDNKGNPTKY